MPLRREVEVMKNWRKSDQPLVSICCTTYNHDAFISMALDGFLMQKTDFSFEILIRDDCSTDNTAEIIREYVKKYPHIIKPIYETENQFSKGVKAMPILYRQALGEYIALCEGDDYWTDPLKLKKQYSVFKGSGNISICFHSAEELDCSKGTRKVICKHFSSDKKVLIDDVISGRGGYMPTASIMFKNTYVSEMVETFEGAPIGDYFMQVYMSSLGGVYFLSDSMCVYRRNSIGGWTSRQKEQSARQSYYLEMVSAIDTFAQNFEDVKLKEQLYLVLRFYAQSYIGSSRGYKKIVAFYKLTRALKSLSVLNVL